jgi:hypothetical protein
VLIYLPIRQRHRRLTPLTTSTIFVAPAITHHHLPFHPPTPNPIQHFLIYSERVTRTVDFSFGTRTQDGRYEISPAQQVREVLGLGHTATRQLDGQLWSSTWLLGPGHRDRVRRRRVVLAPRPNVLTSDYVNYKNLVFCQPAAMVPTVGTEK